MLKECVIEVIPSMLQWRTILACGVVMLNPLFWNVFSRLEYRTHLISKFAGGPRRGVTLLAMGILSFNFCRTTIFHNVMKGNAACLPMQNSSFDVVGYLFVIIGLVLVIASGYRLGFFCSFMGDYFGILLDEKVTGFPFNIVDDPMYVGSALFYLGLSFQHASIVGLLLTGCIALSYLLAVLFEQPFTTQIYANRKKGD
jgi:methylene-fatty-acyl-phospholipid synthase